MFKIYYECTCGGVIRYENSDALDSYMPFWKKEGVWDFRGKVGRSRVAVKEQICGK